MSKKETLKKALQYLKDDYMINSEFMSEDRKKDMQDTIESLEKIISEET